MSKPNPTVQATQAQITDMFAQSTTVLAQPNPNTFERFERRGGLTQALVFVMVAAVVSALIGAFFAPMHDTSFFGTLFSRLIGIPAQFLIFTGAVYLIGRNLFKGTGTFDEVTYSFALFYVPLSLIGSVLGIFGILSWPVHLLVFLAMVYYGYLAVQSSLNLRDTTSSVATLILSGLASMWIGLLFL
ncbi:YIP1 family protein [Deinococcus fonticola]|uniref:YIP1 family protein n=1 Tax=Deinococcus fonticola TaxID=2528713 RepID=UPI0010753D8A|nr:YIP1 family protein [Deinococcus fonticola]